MIETVTPSKLVETVFSHRLPIPSNLIAEYKGGLCDSDPGVGDFLEEQMNTLDWGYVYPTFLYFLTEGMLPIVMGASLHYLLQVDSGDEYGLVFWDELSTCFDFDDTLEYSAFSRYIEELSPAEIVVILMALCRTTRTAPVRKWGKDSLASWKIMASWFGERCIGLDSGCSGRIGGLLNEFYKRCDFVENQQSPELSCN